VLFCDCDACGGRKRPPIFLDGPAARSFDFTASPLARRAVIGGALAAAAVLVTPALAQRQPTLNWPGDDPRQSAPRWTERDRPRRPGPNAGPPVTTDGPSTLQWPDGMPEHRLVLRNAASGESFDGVIWADGRFDGEALARLNALMRDTHSGSVTQCDAQLFDLLACVQARVRKPFTIVSGYRTRQTNAALARRDPHVARNSFHIAGKAADFTVEGVSPRQLAQKAREVGAGGVGLYAGESFIHVDTGPMRSWVY
jgi:uncharacterized protein YcbK (DUF882 family)